MAKRPTFFLSSTIYDFQDLRGAIKFTLESRGCRVLASEFNDFGGNLEQHSYEACLKSIEQADYFVLLVGSRVGGWYDESSRVSITQQEYRTAYERHRQGLLKIVTLVRSEVWQMREDRKALSRHLAQLDMSETERKMAQDYPSKFATDATFISEFLAEIGRNLETGQAVKTGGVKPTGNWIHRFSSFRDVHDVLNPLSFSGRTADEAAYAKALQHELLTVLGRFLIKIDETPRDYRQFLREHIANCPIERTDRFDDTFAIDAKKWQSFSTVMIHTLGRKLNAVVINDAIKSSLFLTYDRVSGSYTQTSAYEALAKLLDEIRMYNESANAENLSIIFEFSPKNIGRPKGNVRLPTMKLLILYGIAHRWVNIVSLSMALIVHLEGRDFEMPELMPFSPVKDMDDEISKEVVTASEARTALGI
ncbi:DUF4062 domain-containing protein [Phenylobacterium sp.]|uniref:DUF4062 domain-containing protein n=1 Tax=Phenylobacterium sp. TaxID=1871053 RepID=UPI003002C480